MCAGPEQCPFHQAMALPTEHPPDRIDPRLWLRMIDNHPPDIRRERFARMLRRDLLHPDVPNWVLEHMRDPERPARPIPKPWELRARRASLGPRIRAARISAQVKQTELATALGVSQGTISRIESGRVVPSLHRFVQIAHGLGVAYDDLLGPIG